MFPFFRNKSTNLWSKSIDWILYQGNIGFYWVKLTKKYWCSCGLSTVASRVMYQQLRATQQRFVGLQDVLKTSSRHVSKMSSTPLLRNSFTSSKTSWRRLEDVFKTSRKTSWKTKNCYAEDVFKTTWRHALKTSWRHTLKTSSRRLGGKQNFTGDICI